MPDQLRIESNERIDINDYRFQINEAPDARARHIPQYVLTNPSGQRNFIMSGFAMSNPSGNQLQVDRGVAILPRREGSLVLYGMVTAEGDATKTVDLSAYSPGTYGIYIRFEYVEGDSSSRVFWEASGGGSETSQVTYTRYNAQWSMRVESSTPGAEWFKIGEVAQATMTITDQRHFYFEGPVNQSYASQWGTGNDRDTNRAQYGITDFQTANAAFRKVLAELKGQPWYATPYSTAGIKDMAEMDKFYLQNMYYSGLGVNALGGLDIQIFNGIAYSGGNLHYTSTTATITLAATRDNYVDLSSSGVITVTDVPVSDPEPGIIGIRLYKIETDATSIVTTTDLRASYNPRYALDFQVDNVDVLNSISLANNKTFRLVDPGGTERPALGMDTGGNIIQYLGTGDDLYYSDQSAVLRYHFDGAATGPIARFIGQEPQLKWYRVNGAEALQDTWISGSDAGEWYLSFTDSTATNRFIRVIDGGRVGINGTTTSAIYPFGVFVHDPSVGNTPAMQIEASNSLGGSALHMYPRALDSDSTITLHEWDGGTWLRSWRMYADSSAGLLAFRFVDDDGSTPIPDFTWLIVDEVTGSVIFQTNADAGANPYTRVGIGDSITTGILAGVQNFMIMTQKNDSATPVAQILYDGTVDGKINFYAHESGTQIESIGKAFTIGTNDAQNLLLETNNTTRMTISSGGNFETGSSGGFNINNTQANRLSSWGSTGLAIGSGYTGGHTGTAGGQLYIQSTTTALAELIGQNKGQIYLRAGTASTTNKYLQIEFDDSVPRSLLTSGGGNYPFYISGSIIQENGIGGTTSSGSAPIYTATGVGPNTMGTTAASSQQIKTNVDDTFSVDWVYNLRPVKFNFLGYEYDQKTDTLTVNADEVNNHPEYGLIAEEVEPLQPDLMSGTPNLKGVYYHKLVPILVKVVQEQKALIDDLTARVTALETP